MSRGATPTHHTNGVWCVVYVRGHFAADLSAAVPTGALVWIVCGGRYPWLRVNKVVAPVYALRRHLRTVEERVNDPLVHRVTMLAASVLCLVHVCACSWWLHPLHMYTLGVDWSLKHLCGYGVQDGFPVSDGQTLFMLGS
eukprot:gene43704-28685_t